VSALPLIVPYRQGALFGRTYDAAQEWDREVRFVALRNAEEPSTPNPTYFDLVNGLWREGVTFLILEHDVVPYAGALQELTHCPHYWCGFWYDPSGGYGNFGCSKIGSKLIAATKNFYEPGTRMGFLKLEETYRKSNVPKKLPEWERVHPALAWYARRCGQEWHCHGKIAHRGTRHSPGGGHELGDEYLTLDGGRPTAARTPHPPLPRVKLGAR
jgi:hypothetical protein